MVIKSTLTLLILGILPLLVGEFWFSYTREDNGGWLHAFAFRYVSGTVTLWALFQLLAVPFIMKDLRFNTLVKVYVCSVVILLLLILIYRLRIRGRAGAPIKRRGFLHEFFGCEKSESIAENLFRLLLVAGIIFLILYQSYYYLALHHIDDDDSRFIVTALEAVEHNQMLRVNPATGEALSVITADEAKDMCSPWMIYVAMLSKLIDLHPATFAHGVFAIVLLGTSYFTLLLIGEKLFPDAVWKRNLFLFLAIFLVQYLGDTLALGAFTLMRNWQGKATLASIGIPFLLYIFLSCGEEGLADLKKTALFFISALALCLLSGMGVIFSAMMAGILGTWLLIAGKRVRDLWKLPLLCLPGIAYGLLYVVIR